ncbi:hypothetical protein LEP1GSC058_2400 [Leptospira fainei serovar Hurstbridge str. BUT 6]|uniref:Tetratricopeptide repeat protein n=2 Tax=Leptospira fainei TaxID=48782 RepID=S3UUY7_9LEPT|nr:hypothetical protein LEP1GSC058_2400 [Leptospira fainei serovar Hurstbridge str. BUT 6]
MNLSVPPRSKMNRSGTGPLFIYLLFCLFTFPAFAVDFDQVYEYYKKGNYDVLVRVSRPLLRQGEVDYKILLLYVASEPNIEEIDKTLTSIYSRHKNHPGVFYNAVYLFLERALVLEAYESGIRWGKIFLEKGESSVRYKEGIYTYACILYSSKDYQSADSVLEKAKGIAKDSKLGKRIRILEFSLEKTKEEK